MGETLRAGLVQLLCAALLTSLAACALKPSPPSVQAQAASQSLRITSSFTQQEYPVHIYLPPNYAASQQLFPVLYVTDGQWYFAMVKQMLEARGLQVILVGIEEGGKNRRQIDYVLPGALAYRQFLTQELIPQVEGKFRINPHQRTLAGTSLGGLLVGICLLLDAQDEAYFRQYWAFDGSFMLLAERSGRDLLSKPYRPNAINGRLLLTGARQGNGPFVANFARFIAPHLPQLAITHKNLNMNHQDVMIPSFQAAIDAYQPDY